MCSVRLPGLTLAGQRATPGTRRPPSYMCVLPLRQGPLLAPNIRLPPLSEVKITSVFSAKMQPIEGVQHLADAGVEMLDEGHDLGPLLADARLALLHLRQPLRRRLDGVVRRGVGQVQEERPARLGTLFEIGAGPVGEQIGGMPLPARSPAG